MGANPGVDGTADELRLRQSRVLLRIQDHREQRSRVALARARHSLTGALAHEAAARADRGAHDVASARSRRQAHDAVAGQAIDLAALSALTALERELATGSAALAQRLQDARAATQASQQALGAAQAAWQAEARKQQRKRTLRDRAAAAWWRAVEAAEEAEQETQAADSWRPDALAHPKGAA